MRTRESRKGDVGYFERKVVPVAPLGMAKIMKSFYLKRLTTDDARKECGGFTVRKTWRQVFNELYTSSTDGLCHLVMGTGIRG